MRLPTWSLLFTEAVNQRRILGLGRWLNGELYLSPLHPSSVKARPGFMNMCPSPVGATVETRLLAANIAPGSVRDPVSRE